jgi:hypothetical protein
MRPLVARTHLGLGKLYARSGDRDKTQEHLGTALGLLREMDIRFWAARTAEELVRLGHLFIIAKDNVSLYEYLRQEFTGEPITVVLDRRRTEQREHDGGPAGDERRLEERRRSGPTDETLHNRGFVIMPESGA